MPTLALSVTEITAILRCPKCTGTLEALDQRFHCLECGQSYPIVDGVTQFVSSEDYVSNFGFEWSRYSETQLDSATSHISEDRFRVTTGFSPEELRGKWVLDVGCGMGRFAEVASRWGANVVGIDLSRAAEVAAQNLADRENVWIARADLRHLPFALNSFDYIYSIGVLHHTPNCERSFKALVPFLKPGGKIAIWLYSAYSKYYRLSDVYRKVTTRMPMRWLHRACQTADGLYYVHRGLRAIPGIGRTLSGGLLYLFPMPLYPNREFRVLDMFDWYSPKFQSKHTYEEVFRWFEDSGLRDLRVLFDPIGVQGRKPLVFGD